MSKSLHAQITAEIDRRERLRQAEKEAELQAKRKKTEAFIWGQLDEEFARCLTNYEDFVSHYISTTESRDFVDFNAITQKLGFSTEFCPDLGAPYYDAHCLSIPAHEKNTRRTPAQKKLLEFEKQLKKARDEKKLALVAECERVKQELMAKRFNYIINKHTVVVPSEIKTQTPFEKGVVIKFFEKYKLRYAGSYDYGCDDNHWHFYL